MLFVLSIFYIISMKNLTKERIIDNKKCFYYNKNLGLFLLKRKKD